MKCYNTSFTMMMMMMQDAHGLVQPNNDLILACIRLEVDSFFDCGCTQAQFSGLIIKWGRLGLTFQLMCLIRLNIRPNNKWAGLGIV